MSERLLANRWHLPITNPEEARDFLQNLVAKGLAYHPDDHPEDVVQDGKRLFSADEAQHLIARMDDAFDYLGSDEVYDTLNPPDKDRLMDALQHVQNQMEDLLKEQAELLSKLAKLA